MYTSAAMLTLANFFAAPSPAAERPEWLNDYHSALRRVQLTQRPLAVFIGEGTAGYNKTSREGQLNRAVEKALAANYVCVYLDINQDGAQTLAQQLEITRGRGIVISDRTGRHQAYHHDGDLAVGDLLENLQRFSDPDFVVRTTQTNAVQVTYQAPRQVAAPAVRNC